MEELKEILSPLLPFIRTEHILPHNSDVLTDAVCTNTLPFFSFRRYTNISHMTRLTRELMQIYHLFFPQLKRGLISTPPLDMLPTAEGGKANDWLRQKNAGIYVRPRLFSPYVEEAKASLVHADKRCFQTVQKAEFNLCSLQESLKEQRLCKDGLISQSLAACNSASPITCHIYAPLSPKPVITLTEFDFMSLCTLSLITSNHH